MSTLHFKVEKHFFPGQHIRGYHNALKTHQEDTLWLAANHYTPKIEASESLGITIIAGHANGFPKEMYEPVWDDLQENARSRGFYISSIWFAENVHQGESGVLNEDKLGDDPAWFDFSRDLLNMVNHFRKSMTRPIYGFAHSMGCAQLVHLSIIHPRLFTGLILIEPVIQDAPRGANASMMATLRPDLWPTRKEAAAPLEKSRVFAQWDKRILEKYLQNLFRDTPTALYPASSTPAGYVTLKTTKHQESWSYNRFNPEPQGDIDGSRSRWTPGRTDGVF